MLQRRCSNPFSGARVVIGHELAGVLLVCTEADFELA